MAAVRGGQFPLCSYIRECKRSILWNQLSEWEMIWHKGSLLSWPSTKIAQYMSRDMIFPTMWCVRPAKAQTSLRIRAVWSEPLLVAWISMTVKLMTEHHLGFLGLTGGCRGSSDSHLSKCHIVGYHMPRLNYLIRRKPWPPGTQLITTLSIFRNLHTITNSTVV